MRGDCRGMIGMAAALAASVAVVVGCVERSERGSSEGRGDSPRVASLSPAISRALVDLGLEDRIVGRSAFCDFLDPAVPIVGDLQSANYERLMELRPTHVLVQAPASGIDRELAALAERNGWSLGQWSGLDSIEDIVRLVRALPGTLYEAGSEERAVVTARSEALLEEMVGALSSGSGETWRGSTLLVHRLEPIGVFGRETYLDDILLRLGGRNAVDARGWAELTLEDVARANPGAIIVIRPGAGEGLSAVDAAGALARLEIDAVREGRIAVMRHGEALLPSTSVIGVAGEMRALLEGLARKVEAGQ